MLRQVVPLNATLRLLVDPSAPARMDGIGKGGELEERHEGGRRRVIERRGVVVHGQADASGYLEIF